MMRKCFIMAMIVVTWLMALAMIVPLTLSDQIRTEDSQCYMSMIPHYAIGMIDTYLYANYFAKCATKSFRY